MVSDNQEEEMSEKQALMLVTRSSIEEFDSELKVLMENCDDILTDIEEKTNLPIYSSISWIEKLKSDLKEIKTQAKIVQKQSKFVSLGRAYLKRLDDEIETFETAEQKFDEEQKETDEETEQPDQESDDDYEEDQ